MDLSYIEPLILNYLDKDTTFEQRIVVQAQLKQFLDTFNKNMASEPIDFNGLLDLYYEHKQATKKPVRKRWGGIIWKVKTPEGHLIETGNLRELCRQYDLPYMKFLDWLRNGRIYDKFQGWQKVEVHDWGLRKPKATIDYRKGKLVSISGQVIEKNPNAVARGMTPERMREVQKARNKKKDENPLSTSGTN